MVSAGCSLVSLSQHHLVGLAEAEKIRQTESSPLPPKQSFSSIIISKQPSNSTEDIFPSEFHVWESADITNSVKLSQIKPFMTKTQLFFKLIPTMKQWGKKTLMINQYLITWKHYTDGTQEGVDNCHENSQRQIVVRFWPNIMALYNGFVGINWITGDQYHLGISPIQIRVFGRHSGNIKRNSEYNR